MLLKRRLICQRCCDSDFTVLSDCTRVCIDNCDQCTIEVSGKIYTGVVEANRCNELTLQLNTFVGTLQLDNCSSVRVSFAQKEMLGSLVWANVDTCSIRCNLNQQGIISGRFDDCAQDNFHAGIQHCDPNVPHEPGCQYIVKQSGGNWKTDELVRIPGGYDFLVAPQPNWLGFQLHLEMYQVTTITKLLVSSAEHSFYLTGPSQSRIHNLNFSQKSRNKGLFACERIVLVIAFYFFFFYFFFFFIHEKYGLFLL